MATCNQSHGLQGTQRSDSAIVAMQVGLSFAKPNARRTVLGFRR